MAASFDYTKVDLYEILDVPVDATEKEIIKAYRKKALKYHPDKNPDSSAVEIFHKLSKALEVLTDSAARAAYDKVLKAREAAKVRHKQLDAKRQKLKQDLELREQAGISEQELKKQQAKNLLAEIERLRKEGSSLLEKEKALLREKLARQKLEEQDVSSDEEESVRIKITWKCSKTDSTNGGYSEQVLKNIFSKYGVIATVLISNKKNGSAVLEFSDPFSQVEYVDAEQGLSTCPLTVKWLSGEKIAMEIKNKVSDSPTPQESHGMSSHLSESLANERDFENLVMMKLRQAEERKRLIAQMQQEDEEQKHRDSLKT